MPILLALPLGDALFADVHTQALGCYTDCHNNTFCSNDAFSVSCYTVWNPSAILMGTPHLWQDSFNDDATARTTRSRTTRPLACALALVRALGGRRGPL